MSLTGWQGGVGMRTLGRRYYRAGQEEQCTKAREAGRPGHIWEWQAAVWPGCFVGSGVRDGDENQRCEEIGGTIHSYPGVVLSPRHQSVSHSPHLDSGWAFTRSPGS